MTSEVRLWSMNSGSATKYGIKQVKWKQPFDHFLWRHRNEMIISSFHTPTSNIICQHNEVLTLREQIYGNEISPFHMPSNESCGTQLEKFITVKMPRYLL